MAQDPKEDLDALIGAYESTFKFNAENRLMESWYVDRAIDVMRARGARSLLSLGLGDGTVSRAFIDGVGDQLERYVVVEGSGAIIDRWRAESDPNQVDVVHAYFEDFDTADRFDAIEMGFVLEHVDDPRLVVTRFARLLSPEGRLFISVPNATSLHRRAGFEAGLLEDMYALSEADHALGHKRFFDVASITALVEDAGLSVVRTEGIFLKPITTGQMRTLTLPPAVLRGFCAVGVDYPELCNGILLEVQQ